MIKGVAIAAVATMGMVGVGSPGHAETLRQAVADALATNPTLAAADARQDALEQSPAQARAAGRLSAAFDGDGGYNKFDYGKGAGGNVTASLPIWTGGRVSSAVRAAGQDVAAGAQGLRDTRAALLEKVVTIYAQLLYDQQAVAIAGADIELLDRQVAEAQARYRLGQSTRTDVARLEAQSASAQATLAAAQATLLQDEADYRAIVGHDPGPLEVPAALGPLPPSREEARRQALEDNPRYQQSLHAADAAAARIDVARAQGAPSLSLSGGYGYDVRLAGAGQSDFPRAANAGITLHVPLLTGGLVAADIREAQANHRAATFDVASAAREATRTVDSVWASLTGAQAQTRANEKSVEAAELALKAVRAEYSFDLRSTLDVLVADESLRASQLALARSRIETIIAQASLLRALGQLDLDAFAVQS